MEIDVKDLDIIGGNRMSEVFKLETKSIWSFKDRGNYGVHKGDYRGNWSPFVPKNIILRYSIENDLVLDQFLGSGTTLIEAKSLNRRGLGCDINSVALEISKKRIEQTSGDTYIRLFNANARDLSFIKKQLC